MSSSLASRISRGDPSAPTPTARPVAPVPLPEDPSSIGVRRKGRGFIPGFNDLAVPPPDSSGRQGTELMHYAFRNYMGPPLLKRQRTEREAQPAAAGPSTDSATKALETKISDVTVQIEEQEEVLGAAERRYSTALLAQSAAQQALEQANQKVQEEDRARQAAKLQRDALRVEKTRHERLMDERVQLAKRMKEIDEAIDGQQDGAGRSG